MKLKRKIMRFILKNLNKKNVIFIVLLSLYLIKHDLIILILLFLTAYKANISVGSFKINNK